MKRYARILTILMLAVFAAGWMSNTVNAANMNTEMALNAIDSGDMGDCEDCPDDSANMQRCDYVCVSSMLAIVPSCESELSATVTTTEKSIHQSMAGRSRLPDPHPPRFIILS